VIKAFFRRRNQQRTGSFSKDYRRNR